MESTNTAGSKVVSVLVVDENQTERQLLTSALRRRPEFRVSVCGLDLDAIVEAIQSSPMDVAVINPEHPSEEFPGLSVLRRLHLTYPEMRKILLLDHYDREMVANAFRSGARGLFCFAEHPFRMLCKCIQAVHEGQVWLSNEQLQYLVEVVAQVPSLRMVNAHGINLLTSREEQVVALVADGLSNREIARELNLSEHTIKKYLFRIFDKLGISTRVELALYAMKHGGPREAEWLAGAEM